MPLVARCRVPARSDRCPERENTTMSFASPLTTPAAEPRPPRMRAVVVREKPTVGSPVWERVPRPVAGIGTVLVRVLATTVISSEIASRAGVSTAKLPLVLGNDFVGVVEEAPTSAELIGRRVVGAYGGYGYTRDGAWADYIVADEADVFPVETSLDPIALAAMPGSFTAASGSLRSLGELDGRTLFIHGGTSGVGLAAATLAIDAGARVIASTRDPAKADRLREHGVHDVVLDDDDLVANVHAAVPGGADLAIELIGVATLSATLRCVHQYGIVCLTGLLQDQANSIRSGVKEDRSVPSFPHPLELIPPTVRLTAGGVHGTARTPELMREWVAGLESGRYRMPIDSVFSLDDIAAAQERRADPAAFGKIVVLVDDGTLPSPTPTHS
ncbi:zinc-binding dehydrogenase [Rathayibacter sp. VKM Ac-2927]|uniref:zinc-binding dehydrogenase n=1 Tax=Rathayibacter sp. VKM Ac-2927 TaxID=2929478 RepID=UPI001FB412C9|nr:zinc-binding dehydrogenase [Rathayibacter sp. VKM Ac-2927]MCJ1688334.1 zinc-binding dehydrogenase [Rathayibacter sp. VKM Ac-2927]